MTTRLRRSAVALLASMALVASCSSGKNDTATRRLRGTLTIAPSASATGCAPVAGHADLVDGAPVYVADRTGIVVTTGTLGTGRDVAGACVRALQMVVPRLDEYRVTVGGFGPIEVTAEGIDAAGGVLDLRLGR